MSNKETKATANVPETPDWFSKGEGESVQTQFPPFLKIKEGARAHCKLVDFDDHDPDFERWVFMALSPAQCHQGPQEAGEDVVVKKGDLFTISNYATLRVSRYIGCEMMIECTGKIKANTPAGFVWGFKATLSPDSAKQLAERKQALALSNG